jgi:hypothetical protein
MTCFSDKPAFETMLKAVPGSVVQIVGAFVQHSKVVIQEQTEVSVVALGPTVPTLPIREVSEVADSRGPCVVPGFVENFAPYSHDALSLCCGSCSLGIVGDVQACPDSACPGDARFTLRGHMGITDQRGTIVRASFNGSVSQSPAFGIAEDQMVEIALDDVAKLAQHLTKLQLLFIVNVEVIRGKSCVMIEDLMLRP